MTPRKLRVLFSFFSYGGNGGLSSEHPDIRTWYCDTMQKATRDPRIEDVSEFEVADTPITMGRNRAVLAGRKRKSDVLVMVDSDQKPDMHLGEPGAKPFWDSSFDFIYNNYDKGPHVIGAPYCGPPPEELVYVFKWTRKGSVPALDRDYHVDKFTRDEAAMMGGIQPVSGLPTGLIMYDMRIFDVTEPEDVDHNGQAKGWFYYEWTDKYAAFKASTEDGTATRDMSTVGCIKLGYNPVYCNWDAWAGHWKPYCVPKPKPITVEMVAGKLAAAARSGVLSSDRMQLIGGQKHQDNAISDFFSKEVSLAGGDTVDLSAVANDKSFLYENNSTYADRGVIVGLVQAHATGGYVVEVGSFVGETAKLMVKGGASVVHCVDTWEGSSSDLTGSIAKMVDLRTLFDDNCKVEIQAGLIRPHQIASPQAAISYQDKALSMVYIDANHDYDSVKADIQAWLPKVKPGGVLAGHDYEIRFKEDGSVAFPGVRKAVEEIFGEDFVKPVPGSSIWYHVVK